MREKWASASLVVILLAGLALGASALDSATEATPELEDKSLVSEPDRSPGLNGAAASGGELPPTQTGPGSDIGFGMSIDPFG